MSDTKARPNGHSPGGGSAAALVKRASCSGASRRARARPWAPLIGAFDGFLQAGGMVNILKKQRRLTFEIDLERSRESGIAYRSKLLRLAERLIGQ